MTDVTPGDTIDPKTTSKDAAVIEETYKRRTKDTVKVPVEVTDNRSGSNRQSL
ncbi:hypothetical protein [Enterococcus faecalis]|uniref:hypothetical protein n=1 Tax=Enterococcus faecalis TaxID=1351 RepID=UPI0030C8CF37